jgi:hypothetical protein
LGHLSAHDFLKESFLAAEVMVKHSFIDARVARDSVHAGPGKTFRSELLESGFPNP